MGIADRLIKAAGAATKALREDNDQEDRGDGDDDEAPSPKQMASLLKQVGMPEPTEETPRALFHDPYSVLDWGGWREKPNAITYETLRLMSQQCVPIAAILRLRTQQAAAFSKPQQGRYDRGFRIILRDRRDQKRSMSPQEALQAAEIERMFETTGMLLPDEKPADRDSFKDFIRKAVRDVLIYDQFVFEKIRDRKGKISRFIVLPSETIRPAVADIEHIDPRVMRQRVSHVQVYEDTVISEFSPDDIAWCVMNPRSDLRTNGFGYSPVEDLINLVTAWLFGFGYNQNFFRQGANIKGLINIKGSIPDRQLKAFRRMWYSMVAGVTNAFKTPILNSEDIQWIPMHSTNNEMEYSAWMDWLTKLITAMFGVDPAEINFVFGNTGQKHSLNQQRPNEDQMTESKDKGLTPLMEHLEDCLNTHIVWEINPDFEFSFTGLNAKEEAKEREGWIAQGKAYKMVDEIRAEQDMDPVPAFDPKKPGAVILDSVWLQAAQGGQAGGADGGGGEEGDGGSKPLEHIPGEDEADQGNDNQEEDSEGTERPEKPFEEADTEPTERIGKSVDSVLAPLIKAVGSKRLKRQIFDIDLED